MDKQSQQDTPGEVGGDDSTYQPYAEDTPLLWIFGDSPQIRIIAALLSERGRDINITDISRLSGLSRSAVYDNIDTLLEFDVVVNTRSVGNSRLYQINTDSEIVEHYQRIERKVLKKYFDSD
jgi:predicted transcriptional regulator